MKRISLAVLVMLAVRAQSGDIDGDWAGTLEVRGKQLRLVLHIASTPKGYAVTLDSLDQNAKGIQASAVHRDVADIETGRVPASVRP